MTAAAKDVPLKRTLLPTLLKLQKKVRGDIGAKFSRTPTRIRDDTLFRDCALAVRHFRPCIRVNVMWGLSRERDGSMRTVNGT